MSPLSGAVIIDYLASLGFAVPLKESCAWKYHIPSEYTVIQGLNVLVQAGSFVSW
jgi:hypothetical protein